MTPGCGRTIFQSRSSTPRIRKPNWVVNIGDYVDIVELFENIDIIINRVNANHYIWNKCFKHNQPGKTPDWGSKKHIFYYYD